MDKFSVASPKYLAFFLKLISQNIDGFGQNDSQGFQYS